jgi:hypothetical protein
MLRLGDRFASQHLAPDRLNSTTHDPRVVPSQSPRDAEERATRADAGGPTVDTSAGSVEQLLSSAGFVRCLAFEGMKLINVEAVPLGCDRLCDASRCGDIWSRNLPWLPSNMWHNYDLSAECFEHVRARCGLFPADMVMTSGCPSAAQTTARPAPIFPLVISTTGAPGFNRPRYALLR